MALPKGSRSGSNVLKFDGERSKRAKPVTTGDSPAKPSNDQAQQAVKTDEITKVAPTSTSETRKSTAKQARDTSTSKTTKNVTNRTKVSNRRFDEVKVERIKAQIARGEYQVNYLQVADKFIEHERYS